MTHKFVRVQCAPPQFAAGASFFPNLERPFQDLRLLTKFNLLPIIYGRGPGRKKICSTFVYPKPKNACHFEIRCKP